MGAAADASGGDGMAALAGVCAISTGAARGAPTWVSQLPGYWVSLITENWRLRMVTPAKGDYIGIPLTAAAQKIAEAWDPAKDAAAGQQCKAYERRGS